MESVSYFFRFAVSSFCSLMCSTVTFIIAAILALCSEASISLSASNTATV